MCPSSKISSVHGGIYNENWTPEIRIIINKAFEEKIAIDLY
jgi:hypothetical protein